MIIFIKPVFAVEHNIKYDIHAQKKNVFKMQSLKFNIKHFHAVTHQRSHSALCYDPVIST